jgi:hypothetical protein
MTFPVSDPPIDFLAFENGLCQVPEANRARRTAALFGLACTLVGPLRNESETGRGYITRKGGRTHLKRLMPSRIPK